MKVEKMNKFIFVLVHVEEDGWSLLGAASELETIVHFKAAALDTPELAYDSKDLKIVQIIWVEKKKQTNKRKVK